MRVFKKIKGIIKFLRVTIEYKLIHPYDYAKKIGVNIGDDCFVPDKGCWSSEPYLITVGNHCQITSGVRIFTHGGGKLPENLFPILMCLER